MISLYLAGSSSDLARVRRYARKLESRGVHITDRWFDDAHLWAGRDDEKTLAEQRSVTRDHVRNMSRSHCVWWLFTTRVSGSWCEAGIAVGMRKTLYVSGAGCSSTVFSSYATVRDPSDDVVLHEILKAVKESSR